MIETIKVNISGQVYNYSKDITINEIYKEHQSKYKYPIILAKVNGRLKELSSQLTDDSTIEFVDLTAKEGNRVHVNGLIFVLQYSVKKIYGPGANILVQHSLDKGVYIQTTFKLTEEKLENIKLVMKEIIKKDIPITKVTIDRIEAKKYFKSIGDETKAGILKYNTNNYITLYRLGNLYNYFYTLMPTSTGVLKDFDLTYIKGNGFILRFPTIYINDKIKKYEHHPNMFGVFEEFKEWAKIINVRNTVDLNKIVSTGKISDLIKMDETLQSNRLLNIAKQINDRKDKVKIVLMAGPSSSGKTTTSRKLCMYLKSFGLNPKAIEMDNYFVEREQTPRDANGKFDFECLEAMDLKLFDKQMSQLLNGEKVLMPTYNFGLGKKEFNESLQLEDKDILIIEGIHALDSNILTNINRERKFKIYISPLTELCMDDHNRISTSDNRLLRRIIRDNRTRDYRVERTLEQWPSVRAGDELYIFPFQDDADATINSAAIYEFGVLKTYAEPLLYSVESDSPYYEEAKRLLNFLKLFLPIPSESIPADAVIREFIGGSYFHH